MGQIGVMFRPEWPPEELPDFVVEAERDGFDEVWLVEDCFLVGGLTMAATALARTESLRVGIGLLPAAMRNPALSAMEIAGLGRLHPGRLEVAFGHGVEPWMRQIDARPPDRLAALEEVVTAVRSLLAGDNVSVDGSFVRLDDVQLRHVPDPPPRVLIGTTGPKALAASGRSADGFLLAEGSGPEAVRWARSMAGGAGETVVYAWLSLDEDRDAAAEALRPQVEAWRGMNLYPRLFELAGVDKGLTPDRVRSLAVAGDADDCARAVRALWEAGADSVVVVPRHEDRAAQMSRFVGDVLPRLRS
jgi:alkanesulfonate monooxygenase SsuD/methylene tetrahydromethanopterin reductase-like flavin-dependent oxidoreductase (luciferase family)